MAALEKILQQVKEGTLSIEEASLSLRKAPFVDLGYAQVDTQRGQRQGFGSHLRSRKNRRAD